MAVKLTVTKHIEKAVAEEAVKDGAAPWIKDLHDRIQAAKNKPRWQGMNWEGAMLAAESVLGDRLALPEIATTAWKGKINNLVAASGLTPDGLARAAAVAKKVFRGSVSLEYLITRASGLLADESRKERRAERAEAGGLDEFEG